MEQGPGSGLDLSPLAPRPISVAWVTISPASPSSRAPQTVSSASMRSDARTGLTR